MGPKGADGHKDIVDELLKFLEVAFHAILYLRNIYASELFEPRKAYGLEVRMCRHIELCDWIRNEALESLRPDLKNNYIGRIVLVVFDPDQKPIERFTFTIEDTGVNPEGPITTANLQFALRNLLTRLSFTDSTLRQNPEGSTFNILAHPRGDAPELAAQKNEAWVAADKKEREIEGKDRLLVPLCDSARIGRIQIDVFAEENTKKSTITAHAEDSMDDDSQA